MRHIFIMLLVSLFSTSLSAQALKNFSEDQATYLSELNTFMNASKRKDNKETYDKFKKNLSGGAFSDAQFQVILSVSNIMLSRKMRSHPYFEGYLRTMNVMSEKGFIETHLDKWNEINTSLLKDLKKSKSKDYSKYLLFCANLIEKNSLNYSKAGMSWYASNSNFSFEYGDKQPFVKFGKMSLEASRKESSLKIQDTEGRYYPLTNKWKGIRGKADWGNIGNKEVYCTFDNYEIDTKKTGYKVDTVTFYHPTFFSDPIQGVFEDKVVIGVKGDRISYPRFGSFEKIIQINEIGENIKYSGGFELQGGNVNGSGDKHNPAHMFFYKKNGDLALVAKAQRFTIRREDRIVAQDVAVSIYFEEDSIYHPNVNFRFEIPKKELQISRGESGNSRTLFFNSHHMLEMDVEQINWGIDSDSISIGQTSLKGSASYQEAKFESLSYYQEKRYRKLQNISTSNPISTIKVYAEDQGTRELDVHELAKKLNPRFDVSSINGLLAELMEGGFIYYDEENELVVVKEKIFHYADASRAKVDFDVISAVSNTPKTNGVLRLGDNSLDVKGVKNVVLSDSQLVAIKPHNGDIKFRKNRDIDFDGKAYIGYSFAEGKDFHFQYEYFSMELDSVVHYTIRVPTKELTRQGDPKLVNLRTKIENFSASVLIDGPDNKSSRENVQELPTLESFTEAYTYYDSPETRGGAYKRDSFYFELTPFVMDSLDSFDPNTLEFEGRLVSAGIFPDIDYRLRIQPDMTLGFKFETPAGGLPIYGDKGQYNDEITLDNQGLLGRGKLEYLSATINSDDILFLPKKLLATAKEVDIKQAFSPTETPKVKGYDVDITWKPYVDSMYISSTENKPFLFFDESYSLDGSIILTPGGLYGEGLFDWPEAFMTSKNYHFLANGVEADTSNMNIKTVGSDKLAFSTQNVNSFIDFEKNTGTFKANSDAISTEMPYNQYRTSMDEFVWDMNKKEIAFSSTNTQEGVFLSIAPKQDSLIFKGEKALYSLQTNLLQIEGVTSIQTADAYITPSDGIVDIKANADMQPLKDATIVANTTNKYHTINRTTVTILGKKSYIATGGFYEYNVAGKKQEIKFDNVSVSRDKVEVPETAEEIEAKKKKKKKNKVVRPKTEMQLVTKGAGTIPDTENFYIDKNTLFQGQAKLNARFKSLQFKGFARLESEILGDSIWFSIDCPIDRKDVVIAYDEPRNLEGEKLHVGLSISRDSADMYSSIMQRPWSRLDRRVFIAKGINKYVPTNDLFVFGDSSKVLNGEKFGNQLTFNNITGKIETEGKYELGNELEHIKAVTAGAGVAYKNKTNYELSLVSLIDFVVPEKLLSIMVNDLNANSFDLPDVDYNNNFFENGLAEIITDKSALALAMKGVTENNKLLLPKTMKPTFFFSKLPMKWSYETASYISTGGIGLGAIKDKPINKMINAYVEFRMTRSGDELNIYIQSPSEDFYFFNYKNGILSTVSSNTTYNDALLGMKKKDLKVKVGDDEFYEIRPTNPGAANFFVRRVKDN